METNTNQANANEVQSVNNKTIETKLYDYAHLVVFCGQCGHKHILEENIPGNKGLQINLPPTSTAEMILVCSQCKNKMGLFYVESNKKDDKVIEETVKEGNTNESIREDDSIEVESV